jgi:Ala-tRNA(Pro) deacylase
MSSSDELPSDRAVFERLRSKLAAAGAEFMVLEHAPVFTSQEAASVRGTSLSSGAKALILQLDGTPAMFVLPADRRLDSRKVRAATGARSIRFANADEVVQITRLRPGAIPPFGSLFGLVTTCDPGLAASAHINFNAGHHAISISVPYADFVRVESPRIADLAAS